MGSYGAGADGHVLSRSKPETLRGQDAIIPHARKQENLIDEERANRMIAATEEIVTSGYEETVLMSASRIPAGSRIDTRVGRKKHTKGVNRGRSEDKGRR